MAEILDKDNYMKFLNDGAIPSNTDKLNQIGSMVQNVKDILQMVLQFKNNSNVPIQQPIKQIVQNPSPEVAIKKPELIIDETLLLAHLDKGINMIQQLSPEWKNKTLNELKKEINNEETKRIIVKYLEPIIKEVVMFK